MKFKVKHDSDTYKKLLELQKKIKSVTKEAKKLAISFGGINYATTGRHLSGGIEAVEFKNPPDKVMWKSVGNSWDNLFIPRAKFKKEWERISALPYIEHKELNAIVGFSAPQTVMSDNGFAWIKTVGLTYCKDEILINTADGSKFSPSPDLIEIVESEFNKIAKTVQKK